jgi:hypothetical protein
MKTTIVKIRALLDRLERNAAPPPKAPPQKLADGRLARVFADIVDLLIPRLRPYEAAIYLYLFRHTILKTGQPFVRVSQNQLRFAVVTSACAGTLRGGRVVAAGPLSENTVKYALGGLSRIGAIRHAGATNRQGTLYRVVPPDEIELCRRARQKRATPATAVKTPPSVGKRATDFYTVHENRLKVFERDGYRCLYCGKALDRSSATLDHVRPIAAGGGHGPDNLVTVCLQCNASKSSRPLSDFLAKRAGGETRPLTRSPRAGAPRVATSPARGEVRRARRKTLSPARERVRAAARG